MAEAKESNGLVGNIQEGDGMMDPQNREVEPLQLEHEHKLSAQKTSEGLKVIVVSSITFAVGVTVALIITIYCAPPEVPPHGSVACEVKECSVVGTDVMKKGGNAVDAAVATTLCVGVHHPFHAGIGGGAMMMVRKHKEQVTEAIDGRETAPLQATPEMYLSDPKAQKTGGLAIGVPGELAALALAHSRHGKLAWKELVKPAADFARNGFTVSKKFADVLNQTSLSDGNDEFAAFFQRAGGEEGEVWQEGDVMTNPLLAATLDTIAEKGPEVFYNGSMGETLVQELSESSLLTKEDLAQYRPIVREPISTLFFNHSVESFPAPGGGALLLLLLNMMEGFLHQRNVSRAVTAHRLIEAIKFSTAHTPLFGDPGYSENMENVTGIVISKDYAEELSNQTDDTQTHNDASWYTGRIYGGGRGQGVEEEEGGTNTAHISVIGPDEDHVSVTSSINSLFGAQVMSSLGFVLNNQMSDFDTPDSASLSSGAGPNTIEGGKRPRSTMTPTLVHSRARPCGIRVALGGGDGARIVSGLAQVMINLFGSDAMPLDEAIDTPRLHHLLDPPKLEYEDGYDEDVIASLVRMGHDDVVKYNIGAGNYISAVNGVAKINETVTGHADVRTGGEADTY